MTKPATHSPLPGEARAASDLDPGLVERARRGDDAAGRDLVEALHRPLLAAVHRFLGGGRHRTETEDLVQDIFLKVFRSLERFEPERGVKLTTWVYTIARNHCFDVLKRRRVPERSLTLRTDAEEQAEVPDVAVVEPSRAAESRELGRKLEQALLALREDHRRVFTMRECEGLDYAAIARATGVAEGTVKSRLHRAKKAMRRRLAGCLAPARVAC